MIEVRAAQYYAAFLIMEGLMIGVFSATDALLFYFFWEAMLIPMFLIIGIWGGPRRVYATIKFFLYTFLGSVFMLVALIYMYVKAGDYAIASFQALPLTLLEQRWIFVAFLLAFAVKVPMWPVHTWLPDAHVEAPTGGSVILAAIMLKMGGYGFLRFSLPITPDASRELDMLIISLSLIAVIYIGLVAIVQQDMKKLIAYSSIAHMGFVTLGAFLVYDIVRATGSARAPAWAWMGAMVQMVSHGLISGALFLCVGVFYDRMHTPQISAYGGVINTMPIFAAFMVMFALANAGLPGTSGFVGEFLVIIAAFKASFWYSLLAAVTLILGASYTLWLVKRVLYRPGGQRSRGRRCRTSTAANSSSSATLADCRPAGRHLAGAAAEDHAADDPPPGRSSDRHARSRCRDANAHDRYDHDLVQRSARDRGDVSRRGDLRGVAGGCFRGRQASRCDFDCHSDRAGGGRRAHRCLRHITHHAVLFDGMYVADELAYVLKLAGFLFVAVVLLYSRTYLENRNILRGEYYVLDADGAARHLRADLRQQPVDGVYRRRAAGPVRLRHGGLRSGFGHCSRIGHQVLRARARFASGTLLYGMSLIYGLTGTLDLEPIAT